MGVADHVLESISGHLSRRMLKHYSHIRIDAKRQALEALDAQRRRVLPQADNGADRSSRFRGRPITVLSQSLISLTLRGFFSAPVRQSA
jgi:hypothetical protein